MAGELSAILEHVDRIAELDLDGVEPTSHVVALENVLRADEPRPSWPRETRPRAGAGPGRRRVPRALAPGVTRSCLELTAAEATRRDRRGELAPDEYFDAYAEAAAGDELNAYLWRADRGTQSPPPDARRRRAACRGVAVAVKDIFCTEGIATTAGSRILEGYRPAVHGHRGAQARRRRRAAARQDQHGRVRDGLLERELRPTGRSETRGIAAASRAAPPGGSAAAVAGRLAPVGDRHRHRRLDPPAGGAVRDRRPEADLRRDLPLRDDRLRLLARPVRAADPRRHRRSAAAAAPWRAATRATRPRSGSRAGSSCPRCEDLDGPALRRRRATSRARPRGSRPASRDVFERTPGRHR